MLPLMHVCTINRHYFIPLTRAARTNRTPMASALANVIEEVVVEADRCNKSIAGVGLI